MGPRQSRISTPVARAERQDERKEFSQPLTTQALILAMIRFIVTADICQAFQHFGGAIARFNAISLFLHLATTEGLMVAIAYDNIPRQRLEQFARDRATNLDYFRYLSEEK